MTSPQTPAATVIHSCWSARLLLTVLACLFGRASQSDAYSISTYGQYTILAGVHEDDAQAVHASMYAFGGMTPLYLDAYADLDTVYYSSIWMKSDGVYREIFLDWPVHHVRDRMKSSDPANQLLQVDAWTKNEGAINYGPDYHPAWYFETYCCGIWTKEELPERRLEYQPVGQPNSIINNYWVAYYGPGTWTMPEVHDALLSQGFELQSASVVRPSYPQAYPAVIPWVEYDPEWWQSYSFSQSAIVALYEKNSVPTSGLFKLTLDEAKDYVNEETASGWKPIQAEIYQGHPWGAQWSSDESAWQIKCGIITRKDERSHQIAWELPVDSVKDVHGIAHLYWMRPLSITGSRSSDTYDQVRYTVVFRELDITVKDVHKPADDFQNHPGFGDNGRKP